MIRCVLFAPVARIPLPPPVTMPTVRRSDAPPPSPAGRHIRLRRLLITPLPLALLMTGYQCLAQSSSTISIFTNAVPATSASSDTRPIALGVKFWSSQAGTISAIRFYRGATSPNGYIASLYSSNGRATLGSVTMSTESSPVPGWQQAVFDAPIPINANTTYVAAYYAPSGQYAYTNYGLTQTVTNAPLNAPAGSLVGGNGVVGGYGFPNGAWNDTNFFVDVAFVPAAGSSPYLSIVLTPANPTIPSTAEPSSVVAKIAVTWSDGSAFTGTLSFGAPNFNGGGVYAIDSANNLIIDPSGPGLDFFTAGSLQNVTIVATQ